MVKGKAQKAVLELLLCVRGGAGYKQCVIIQENEKSLKVVSY